MGKETWEGLQWGGKKGKAIGCKEAAVFYLVHAGHRLEAGTLRALSACRRT